MKLLLFSKAICKKRLLLLSVFFICALQVFAQPSNDDCANAINRSSSTNCNTNSYTMNNATASAGIPVGCASGGTHYDVWFKFTANNATHTVTISNLGANFTSPELQIFSGTCGALTSLVCGTTTVTATGLTSGNVYYVRVSKVGSNVTTNGGFDICITNPNPPPANDECTGATSLTSSTSCNNTQYSMRYSTASAGIPVGCASGGVHYDVWFQFTAVSTSQTVTISSLGSNITNPELQLFSGTCGSLTSLVCGTTTLTGTGLTIGNTYYVRMSNIGSAPTGGGSNSQFNLCLTNQNPPPANDNCSGATLLTSNYSCSSTTGNLRYATSANPPAGACGGATLTTTFDVWYRFQAVNATQTVTVGNLGANLSAASTYMEVLSGACGSLTSLGCQTVSTTSGRRTVAGLTVGNFYYVRVYVLLSPTASSTSNWNFDICVQHPPANDDCVGAVALTPGVACTNTSGTLDLSTISVGFPAGCVPASSYDVWYKFTAAAVTETITLNNLGSSLLAANMRIQIFSGTCAVLTSIGCVNATTITQAGLLIGTTYYVRIAYPSNPSGIGTVANFNICVTNAASPPANNQCSGAILLTSSTVCSNVSATFINATASAGLPACGNAASPDVWFKFVAQSAYPVITLSSLGANLSAANPRIQLFSGVCGSLVQLTGACVASPLNTATTPGGLGLTVGATYYVRITTVNLAAPVAAGTYTFNICITDPVAASIDYGKTYVNLTAGTTGGTVNPGDVLEIRAILVVARPGNAGPIKAIDSLAFYDTLTAGGGFKLLKDSMSVRTNEGKLFRPSKTTYFTDANDVTDEAWTTTAGAGTDTALQINMGLGATYAARGKLRTSSKPSNFGSTCIIMATYRVKVNAPYDTPIDFGGGAFRYRDTATGIFYTINFPKDSLMVYISPGSCPDATSPINIVGDEVNGTFGASPGPLGSPQSRGTSPNTNYLYAPFAASAPQDYYYSIANNTSANGSVIQTVTKPNAAARVFGVWDITGDHSGASNTAKGNAPCDPTKPIDPITNPCGYMLVINSAYKTDLAFNFNVNGVCTETFYEISGWFKNICYKCGCDSNGVGTGGAGFIPTASGDSAGVRPNIAIKINGIDYYSTGDLVYQGLGGTQTGSDTLNKWVKRAFVYKTKPGESSFNISFRNNAPGGGGNDWALDDIMIRTCYPNMIYSPSSSPTVCAGRTLTLTDTVRSYYNVYIYYKWQRSVDAGVSWVDLAGSSGVASTVWNGSSYEYVSTYTLPPSATTPNNNGDLYRMVVATNAANLAGSCSYSDVTTVTLTVLNNCIDIDDDDDGIPDYVEFNNPVALQDADSDGIPNWSDTDYPGFVDNNFDGVNDNFDWGADSDNNGIPNYLEPGFPGFVDVNNDGINDNSDKDLDGIPNQYDLDSDNDGIPDVVEAYGVDTDGDGKIDNYTDTDNDGLSQNVDANNTGVKGSGNGLGAPDFDGDGIPNYLDTDSDNDGIPDVVEVDGAYTTNNGKLANFVDANKDGLSDNNFAATALLKTGADILPVDGRADNYPFKNKDQDFRPNAYDMDSDGDGIVDVLEAGFPDVNLDGKIDGVIGANGWATVISSQPSLILRYTDSDPFPDYLDIDSDGDGIPDNIEGQSTAGYKLPGTLDSDGDGLVNTYDNIVGFGGSGIFLYDHDGDNIPDYRDLDTDNDGIPDIIEGNDFNLNGIFDDDVTLTGLDTDGDGLDNRFDSLNSVTNIKGTSYRMGTGGTFTGDPTPGSRTTVQKTIPSQTDRDWRYVGSVLPVQFLSFTGIKQKSIVLLNWNIIAEKPVERFEVERSIDNSNFSKVQTVTQQVLLNITQNFSVNDDISNVSNPVIYYRLKVVGKSGEIKYSNIIVVRSDIVNLDFVITPNPTTKMVSVKFNSSFATEVFIYLYDNNGKLLMTQKQKTVRGGNSIVITDLNKFNTGVYELKVITGEETFVKKLMIRK